MECLFAMLLYIIVVAMRCECTAVAAMWSGIISAHRWYVGYVVQSRWKIEPTVPNPCQPSARFITT